MQYWCGSHLLSLVHAVLVWLSSIESSACSTGVALNDGV